jgi:hypothetical protein
MKKKPNLANKFVIAYDTLCEGNQCMMEGEGDEATPCLFDTREKAIIEMFDDALSMLISQEKSDLKELGVTQKKLAEMKNISKSKDSAKMEDFLMVNSEMNYNGEWVEPASEFIMNRKLVFGNEGFAVTGTKL